jgi:8-oxo-dGTP pyrophosphatase MutT (NUDIX family)
MTEVKKTEDNDLPIEVVDRRLACENTKFFVYFDHVIDKAGHEVRDYLVVAPKNVGTNLVTGVAILPIVDGQAGLIRIYRPAVRAYSWEIPHGFVDLAESDISSGLRELLEETGLTVESRFFSSLGYITPDSGVLAARVHLFLAEACHTTQQIQPELGFREFRCFPILELEEMIKRSEIQDTFTLAAWCKYRLLQNTRRSASKSAGMRFRGWPSCLAKS